jgi:broad specificity phosphatase PhoE
VTGVYSSATREEGGEDAPLVEGQQEEARRVVAFLKRRGFSENAQIWSSPLQRAQETALLISREGKWSDLRILPQLRESGAGTQEGQPVPKGEESLSTAEVWTLHSEHAHQVGGGESFEDVKQRMTEAFRTILEQTPPGRDTILVTHGTPSRALIQALVSGIDVCLPTWGVAAFTSEPIPSNLTKEW